MSQTKSAYDELAEIINRRIRLAQLDAQADLLNEMIERPVDVNEREWVKAKLAQLKEEVAKL